ncbi:putative ubiquitin-conjugating enzyme E2 [Acaromyces ingoldii]|uniref:Putative ubiquitin-conjugating enzyme E2 n=1 Tax=Acaromyces ingoldii TaxID=215250 RepID=A0A316YKL1_9BASI|nr:putative ubiquitin-conjugating enzyme E2 [Acaromyces ingoldii]PWN89967.1 putative ubiquitin-conjugating enzyme E2 [Acaromyces ingoldii]
MAASTQGQAPAATLRRLMKEYQTEQQQAASSSSGSKASTRDENVLRLAPRDADAGDLLQWDATLRGPVGGAYEGGLFDVAITVPTTYPTKPPSMKFVSRIWHPNVSWKTGEICLDVLSSQWSPAWTLSSALTAVVALLDAPEPDSPLNVDAATVFRTGDQRAYRTMCHMYTLLHAAP